MWGEFWNRRDRTLILRIPCGQFAQQESYVEQLLSAVTVIDWRTDFLTRAMPEQCFLNVSVQGELQKLKALSTQYENKVICIINTEYVLTRFSAEDREVFWRSLWSDFPYNAAILIYGVLDTQELLPHNLEQWKTARRLVPCE